MFQALLVKNANYKSLEELQPEWNHVDVDLHLNALLANELEIEV